MRALTISDSTTQQAAQKQEKEQEPQEPQEEQQQQQQEQEPPMVVPWYVPDDMTDEVRFVLEHVRIDGQDAIEPRPEGPVMPYIL